MLNSGSKWRKWDLHAHTPLDHEWINRPTFNSDIEKRNFAQEYIEFAVEQKLAVIGIVDHNFCNNLSDSLIPFIQIEARSKNITILPGFEITVIDGSGIHVLVIFPENTNLELIKSIVDQCFDPGINLTPRGGVPISNKTLDELKKLIDKTIESTGNPLQDILFIFAHADRNNGVLEKRTITGNRRLTEWHKPFINITQISKKPEEFTDGFMKEVITARHNEYGREMTYICASDCRCINIVDCTEGRFHLGQKFAWIKSQPTFEGLKQTIFESSLRVKIQDFDPYLDYPKAYFSKIIIEDQIDVFNNGKLYLEPHEIELNRDLVTIIGGRGSGKSILLDHLLISFKNNESIVEGNRRLQEIGHPSDFKIEYTKSDGERENYVLSNENYLNYVHISQGEVKQVIEKPDEFSKVIFRMLSITSDIDMEIITKVNEKLGVYLSKIEMLDRYNLEENVKNKEKYTKFIKDLKNEENQALIEEFQNNESRKTQIQHFRSKNIALIDELIEIEKNVNDRFLEIENIYLSITDEELKIYNVHLSIQIQQLKNTNFSLDKKLEDLETENSTIKIKFEDAGFTHDINALTSQLSEYERQLNRCNIEMKAFEELEKSIIEIKTEFMSTISEFKNSIEAKEEEMSLKWNELKNSNNTSQQEVKDVLSENILLNSNIHINLDLFYQLFDRHINGQKFRAAGGKSRLKRIKDEIIKLENINDFFNFINGQNMILVGEGEKVGIYEFIEKSYSIDEIFYDQDTKKQLFKTIIDNITELVQLNANVRVTHNGNIKDIHELSAGMKGTLYTKVKLLTNAFETPVVFDQPEDDLDNDFIMNNMVTLFRKLKEYRQIIIVTHNPNLVINADAEQVIIASNDNEHISYQSGAIEDKEIRDKICQILEGGELAFKQRERKYDIS